MEKKKVTARKILAEKTFFLTYIKPNEYNAYQLDSFFSVPRGEVYKSLKTENYFDTYIGRNNNCRKGREEKLLYGRVEPVIDRIKTVVALNPFDEYILKDKLTSKFFRFFLESKLSYLKRVNSINSMEEILGCFDVLLVIIAEWKLVQGLINNIDSIDAYVSEKNKLAKEIDERLNFTEKIGNMPLDIYKEFPIFCLFPKSVLVKVKGISVLGIIINEVEPLLNGINELNSISPAFEIKK